MKNGDSDSDSDKIKASDVKRMLNDTTCRAHRAQTDQQHAQIDQQRWLMRIFISVFVVSVAAGVGWAMKSNGDSRAQDEKITAINDRVDDLGPIIIKMQDAAIDIAMDVGQMKGMWAARLQDK